MHEFVTGGLIAVDPVTVRINIGRNQRERQPQECRRDWCRGRRVRVAVHVVFHETVLRLVLRDLGLQLCVQGDVEVEDTEANARFCEVSTDGHLHRGETVGRESICASKDR